MPLGMFIDSPYCVYVRGWRDSHRCIRMGDYYSILRGGFLRCSFRQSGQCESLYFVERATGLAPRFLCPQV